MQTLDETPIAMSTRSGFVPLYRTRGIAYMDWKPDVGRLVDLATRLQNWQMAEHEPILMRNDRLLASLLKHPLIDMQPGDNLIVSPLVPYHLLQSLVGLDIEVRWADLDPYTGLMVDIDDLIDRNTAAIVTHDTAGMPNDYSRLLRYGIPIIEDASLAISTVYQFQSLSVGGGDFVVFDLPWSVVDPTNRHSFVFTSAGIESDVGVMLSTTNLQEWADIVDNLGSDAERQRAVARSLCRALGQSTRGSRWISVQPYDPNYSYPFLLILASYPDSLLSHLRLAGVGCARYYELGSSYIAFAEHARPLPGAEFFVNHHLVLPCGWWLEDDDVADIIRLVLDWHGSP